jgi:hypothetical protein
MAATLRAAVFGAFLSLVGVSVATGDAGIPNVLVTAPTPPTARELAGNAVPDFVTSHSTPSRVLGQLARWSDPVCPETAGLPASMNEFVTARIIAVAAAVGAPHAESPNCKPNIVILFALRPEEQAQRMLKRDSQSLGFHYPAETKNFMAFTHPIQGWYVTSSRNWKGIETIDDSLPLGLDLTAPPNEALRAGKVAAGEPGSRLDNYVSSHVVFATIIADFSKIRGMTLGPLADYIAVLALTQARMTEGCSQLPSIMDLMSAGCDEDKKPQRVTAGDLAYLRALYSADLELTVDRERSTIADAMFRQFRRER